MARFNFDGSKVSPKKLVQGGNWGDEFLDFPLLSDRILAFVSGEKSGLCAGWFSSWGLLLRCHDVLIDILCSLALYCWNLHGLPWKIHQLDGSICYSKTFQLPWCLQVCRLPGTITGHTLCDFWLNLRQFFSRSTVLVIGLSFTFIVCRASWRYVE